MGGDLTFDLTDGRVARGQVKNPQGAGLGVLLPGLNYGCDKPLLAETSKLLQDEYGLKVVELTLPRYTDDAAFKAEDREAQLATFAADGAALLPQLEDLATPGPQVFAGKSLGTMVLGGMAEAGLPDAARLIWLTPSLRNTPLLGQMRAARRPAFSLIGSRDPSVGITRSLPYNQIADLVHLEVGGMDHGWRHMDGERASLMGLAQAMVGMKRWLDQVL